MNYFVHFLCSKGGSKTPRSSLPRPHFSLYLPHLNIFKLNVYVPLLYTELRMCLLIWPDAPLIRRCHCRAKQDLGPLCSSSFALCMLLGRSLIRAWTLSVASIKCLFLFRLFRLFPNGHRWVANWVRVATSYFLAEKNNVFYIPNSVRQECCNFHLSCNLCFYGELSVNDVFLLTGTHIIPFLSVSASFNLVPPKLTQMTSGCWETIAAQWQKNRCSVKSWQCYSLVLQ